MKNNPYSMEQSIQLILNGFNRIYDALFSIDLVTETAELVFCIDKYAGLFSNISSYSDCLRTYVNSRISPKYHNIVYNFADFSTLTNRLNNQAMISIEYQAIDEGWKRSILVPSEYNAEGNITSLLLIIAPITDEVSWRKHLIKVSETEPMTTLLNRQSGVKKMQEMMNKNEDGLFLYMDIDHFKSINDYCGHSVGDTILQQFARILQELYPNQILIRIGGDEFGVFLKGRMNEQQLIRSLKPLFARFNTLNDLLEMKHAGITISLSVGAAQYFAFSKVSIDELFRLADRRLYESKKFTGNHLTYIETNVAAPWYAIKNC